MKYTTKQGKEIIIKDIFTYGAAKKERAVLMEWINTQDVDVNNPENINIPLLNTLKAQEVVIKEMTWLSEDEINELTEYDVNEIYKIINDIRQEWYKKK